MNRRLLFDSAACLDATFLPAGSAPRIAVVDLEAVGKAFREMSDRLNAILQRPSCNAP